MMQPLFIIMNIQQIQRQFSRIGARVKVHPPAPRAWWDRNKPQESLTIDIGDDASGEYFDITVVGNAVDDAQVLDVQPGLRHLLLMSHQDDSKHKFLCGHDERHWFVAAVPERAAVSSVRTAFDALKPPAVRAKELRLGVKPRKRNRRRNEAFIRQGEWFFVPVEDRRAINDRVVLRHEPISRGNGGKPHLCEEVVRQGGEMVYVCSQYPRGADRTRIRAVDQPSACHSQLNLAGSASKPYRIRAWLCAPSRSQDDPPGWLA